jgi:ABC-type proline/glycine betaine transport system substrate-binding protein
LTLRSIKPYGLFIDRWVNLLNKGESEMTGKLIFTTTALALCAHQATANCDTVRMAEPGWTDLALTTGVASVVLEGLGYATESYVLGIPVTCPPRLLHS